MGKETTKRLAGLSEQERRALLAEILRKKTAKTRTAQLSFAQQRLWFIDQLEPGNVAYTMFRAMRLRGTLDVTALEQGFNQVLQRHESLRTTFAAKEGEPYQVIAPIRQETVPVVDLSTLSEAQRGVDVQRLAHEEVQRPFDLASGPLVRCTLLRLAHNEHILLLTLHHIVSDGWSMNILFREIILLSQAYSDGKENPLPKLPLQYADFAIWQREWLQGEVLEAQMSYWRKQLARAPAALEVPTDHPRPTTQTYHGARLHLVLSKKLSLALQTLSRQADVTLFMILLAAFQSLLFRYTGQTNIVVGSPIANRTRRELEELIGFFANTLVLHVDLSGNPSFHQLLQRVRKTCLEAYAHQDVPFEKLVSELHVERDLSRNPLFQVMFILQNTPLKIPDFSGLRAEPLEIEPDRTHFDLTLSLTETKQGLAGTMEYNADLFEPETISRMIRHFQILLEGIVTDPTVQIQDLPMLDAAELHQILVEWNNTQVEYPHVKCIHELFEEQVEKTPDAVAVVFEDQQLTYAQLNARANQLAHYLRSQGVGPDVLVGICMERSLEMIVSLLGILKAGGAYVPLDPDYPKERLAFIVADSHLSVLLTQEHLVIDLPEHQARLICLDTDWLVIDQEQGTNPGLVVSRDQLAYVIYTSGSTGRPKGVQVVQGAVTNFLMSMRREPGIMPDDRLLSVTTLSFDIAGLELYLPLIVGAQVDVVPREMAADGFRLLECLKTSGATMMQATPATWRLLLEAGWDETERLKVLCGGEALTPELASLLLRHSSSLWNMYGPTETTIWSTLNRVEKADGIVPIGHPIANTQVYVLDEHLNPTPIGVPGELYIGGDGLARGYLNRADLTAEKFIPNPFGIHSRADGGTRLYKTGDLVRWLPNGNLEYLGRIDSQVKVHGFRIELGEIESALSQCPGVQQAVVIVCEDRPGDKRLVAYVVSPTELLVDELRSALKTKLPDYMLPAAFVFINELPLTPNRKVDRKALPAPSRERPELAQKYVAPRTPLEETLVEVWKEILNTDQIGIHDNFFAAGGDSLQSIRLLAHMQERTGLHPTPRQFMLHPTIAELVTLPAAVQTPDEQRVIFGKVPVTPNGLRFLTWQPAPWWRVVELLLELPTSLKASMLQDVIQELVRHHDSLRLRIMKDDPGYRQFIEESDNAIFVQRDISHLSEEEQEKEITEEIEKQWASLDFAKGPLLRLVYFERGAPRPAYALLIVHHFLTDMHSTQVLLEDLKTACSQRLKDEPIRLPPKTTSFKTWARRLDEYANSEAGEKEREYWLSLPWEKVQPMPLDYPENLVLAETTSGTVHGHYLYRTEKFLWATLNVDDTQALLKSQYAYGVSMTDILLTGLVIAFYHWRGIHPLHVVSGNNGRHIFDDLDLSRTIGDITCYFPMLLKLADFSTSYGSMLKSIKSQIDRIPNHGCSRDWVRYRYWDAFESRLPNLVHLFFLYNGIRENKKQEQNDLMRRVVLLSKKNPTLRKPEDTQLPMQTTAQPLECTAEIIDSQLSMRWTYKEGLHTRAHVEQLVDIYLDVLRSIANDKIV